jgi:hypothetical protein
MSMIQLQDLSAVINGASRYNGNAFDTVHVEIFLVTNEPIAAEQFWYVPAGVTVPPAVLDIFKLTNLPMYPTSEANLLKGIDDIKQQAENGNLQEVINDSAKLMLLSVLKKVALSPVPGSQNLYLLSYDYKLYPLKDQPNTYEFKVVLPFDGLQLNPSGGRVQVTLLTPINSIVDPQYTKGVDINGTELAELVKPIENTKRQLVAFEYHLDPEFTVRYKY